MTVTATRINESLAFAVEVRITDVSGTQTTCIASDVGHIGSLTGTDTETGTPELGSGELLATGLLPLGAMPLYRRRRTCRAAQEPTLEA